jgi:hypothetical protein
MKLDLEIVGCLPEGSMGRSRNNPELTRTLQYRITAELRDRAYNSGSVMPLVFLAQSR